ncbi:MAG: hypothetical protein IPL03_09710 [Sterolibacteriaceae bacterium]|nr:hypothetical protein [Candidatus Methylophosphatis haderslevensis]
MIERSARLAAAVVLALLVPLLIAGKAKAGGELFDGCVDARARPVQSTIDYGLPQLAHAAMENGRAVVRYNPALMPDLPTRARLFFFAHECARVALGQPLGAECSLQQARQADCWALATLQRSGEADASLAADLAAPEIDWAALPGPARTVDLAACAKPAGALRLPDSAPPSVTQSRQNRCVHACGDRLWQCQNRCRDEACRGQCLGHYGSCESACGG